MYTIIELLQQNHNNTGTAVRMQYVEDLHPSGRMSIWRDVPLS